MAVKQNGYDMITVGDTTVDVFLDIDEKTALCDVDKKKEWLRIKYASKVPVKHVNKVVGTGNAPNVAVGTSRLGLKTAIYTMLGDDDKGSQIVKKFTKDKIDTRYVAASKDTDTNMSVVIDFKGDRTLLVHHEHKEYTLPKFAKTRWIYFSSICGNHDEFNAALAAHVTKKKIKLGFNPGSMQMRLGARKLKPILSICDVIFLNVEEAQRLTKRKTRDIKRLLRAVKKMGPKIVAITDGRAGSYTYDGRTMYRAGIIDLPVVERTGSGDAYASGFISALYHGHTVPEAMRWGTINGGHAAMEIGSQEGLLRKRQLENLLRRHTHFQPQTL